MSESGIPGAQNYRNTGALPERLPGMARIMDAAGSSASKMVDLLLMKGTVVPEPSSVPEAARAAARVSVANVVNDSWPLSGDQQIAVAVALMAAVPFIVAAAVAEERATTGRAAEQLKAKDAEERGEGICRTCALPIWNEGGMVGGYKRETGWSDRIERGGDSLVCFKAIDYRHVPLEGREAAIWDNAVRAALASPGEGRLPRKQAPKIPTVEVPKVP